VQFYYIKHSHT